jgi:hypothetical protein
MDWNEIKIKYGQENKGTEGKWNEIKTLRITGFLDLVHRQVSYPVILSVTHRRENPLEST